MAYESGESIGAVIGEVMANDPAVREAYRKLLIAGATQMRRLLVLGTTEERTAILRTIVPHAMKALIKSDAAAQDSELLGAFERIQAAVRGETPSDVA